MTAEENGHTKETHPVPPHPFGLDDILVKVGQFGRFQICFFLFAFLLIVFHTTLKYGFVFTAGTVVHRCRIAECDGLTNNSYDAPWVEFSIPKSHAGKFDKCHRFGPSLKLNETHQETCGVEKFNQSYATDCGRDFIFRDKEFTISNDFGIFCADEWKLAMAGTVLNIGQLFGIPLGGYFSDRFGRKTVLAVGGFLSALTGITRSFSPNYYMFVSLSFLDNIFGATIYGTIYVLALEILGPEFRVFAYAFLPMCAATSRFILAVAAKNLHNWRLFERTFYIPGLFLILVLPWILPESCRWLLARGKDDEAVKILQKIARTNKRKLSESDVEKLLKANRHSLLGVDTKASKFLIRDALKLFPWRIINCSFCWFANVFVFYGLSLNSSLLGGNKYDNFMFVSLIEIPGSILLSLTINRFGRRHSLLAFLFLSGSCIAGMAIVSSELHQVKLILNLIGKMMITASSHTLYVFTSEVFPTNARNGLLSFCSSIGRFGSIAAPQTPLVAKYYVSAPAILFSICAFLSGALVLFFPETRETVLPTTLQDANNIGKSTEVVIEPELEPETKDKLLESKASNV